MFIANQYYCDFSSQVYREAVPGVLLPTNGVALDCVIGDLFDHLIVNF